MRKWTIAAGRLSALGFPLPLFAAFKRTLHLQTHTHTIGNPSRSSNPGPPAPLGPAPAPRAPRGLPPLSALPLTPAPPGSLCSVSVAGTGDVATRRGAAASRASSCEPPSDQPQEARLPPQPERRRCLRGGGVLLPPCMRHRRSACATSRAGRQRLPAHRASRSASCRAACRPFGDAPCVCFNGREHRSRGRPVSAAHAASPGASLRSRSRRSAHQTANGSRRHGCEA